MPRSAIHKSSKAVRRMSVEIVDELLAEIHAMPEFQAKFAAGMTLDASAMRVFYTAGDCAVRAMLRLEEEQQQQQQQQRA
jgi:hypothetical protein